MPRDVSLLRGINVGGHRITMDELRRHFAALKFTDIETFIASGNVLFNTADTDIAALESRIEHHLASALGYDVPTFIRTLPELKAVAQRIPFAPADTTNEAWSRYVMFLRGAPPAALAREIANLSGATDEFCPQGREIHWLCRGRISDPTPAAKAFEKLLRAARLESTSRNLNMLRKLVAQFGEATAAPRKPAGRQSRR